MRLGKYIKRIKRYFVGGDEESLQTMPEVSRAMAEDSPRSIRFTLWAIGAFFLFFILWAGLANIDEVTRGDGKAIPSSRLQKIQNLEGGIITEVFIREGQVVNAGDPLLRLDDTRFASNVGETEADRLALLSRIERLNAEINGQELVLSEEITTQAPKIAAGEKELYNSRRQQLHNEISGLEEQLIQRQQELRDFSAKEIQFRNSLGLLQQEIKMSEPLIAEGAISKVEVLRLRRAEVETRGQLDSIKLSIPRAESAIKESENKIEETRSRYKSEALSQLSEAQTSLNKIEATGKALEDRVNRTLVVSPVRGIVQQVLVNTIGGVIQPGSDLVEIVPLDDKLLVEAKIRPQDIAFLHPGQDAIIKLTAYDYTIYGGLKGQLEQISPDTVTDKEGNSFYIIRLRTDKNYLGSADKPLLIIPGMVASVDIITGKKTILSYLLKPIIRANAEALRER
ncbi:MULTISPECIES: HlyD family type I secretion periplasmic adaptor subunit [Pectobacterium]|uniref:Membrane fusion protein (MFP) family protein n=1 Tax=Pectobacterium carotovorum subsp. carotovorum TaxID=555 RepID=A0AA40J0S2_PECCC|nr:MULTISPECIES: HlyD family type I secretion periplasmic adaptor subunit [Pectobacterium]KAA3666524.1 HlyD family type I secretion periplasmic adaptor subunit [Pectobacterium carotovorum subsp. carotovorum]KFW97773.1 hemolysin secretion protein D [Pectobacterium carotovorum subsp. carotovorum]KHS82475.1 hemolysin secretion protein D [Pectobacterium carotovorum subsp. carotovorum]KHT22328.1 hemolysin secretion protein D [Pectobacterium carotovorum subsp. carotovorum]KHT26196.1 hemolysin secret